MKSQSDRDELSVEFEKERSIRRAAVVLAANQRRSREDLHQLISHIAQCVLPIQHPEHAQEEYADIINAALDRLGDDAFAAWVKKVFQELNH